MNDELEQMRINASLKEYRQMIGPDYADAPDYRALAAQLATILEDVRQFGFYFDPAPLSSAADSLNERIAAALDAARKVGIP